jgi:hypothetical protein
MSPSLPPPTPAFDSPVIGLFLHYVLPSAFVIARRHATVDAFVAGCFSRQLLFTAAFTAAATAALRFWDVVSGVPSKLGIK